MPNSDVERLDELNGVLLKDGWPAWLDSTFVGRNGPTVQLRPGAGPDVLKLIEELAARLGVQVTEGESYFRLE